MADVFEQKLDLANALSGKGIAKARQNQPHDAVACFEEAMDLLQSLLTDMSQNSDDPLRRTKEIAVGSALGQTAVNLGVTLRTISKQERNSHHYAEMALRYYDLAITMFVPLIENGVSEFLSDLATAHMVRGNILVDLGRADEAVACIEDSIKSYRELIQTSESQPHFQHELGRALLNLGVAHGAKEQTRLALQAFEDCIAILQPLVNQAGYSPAAGDLEKALRNKANAMVQLEGSSGGS